MSQKIKLVYSREEMQKINIETLQSRGVTVLQIAELSNPPFINLFVIVSNVSSPFEK